jgi:predicted acylesterase/phospholipase RssA
VPISKAVQASAALPGLYPPVEIGGRYYVDGALKKTLHASVALEQGVKLVLAVNPLVPYDSDLSVTPHAHAPRRLIEGGLPAVLSQTFRSIIRSRMQSGLERYNVEYPDADIVLFEPNRDDAEVFFTNIFSYASRRRLGEHAYQKTRKELFERRHELAPILARHGIRLKLDVVTDPARHLVRGTRMHPPPRGPMAVKRQLEHTLGDLDRWLKHHAPRAA